VNHTNNCQTFKQVLLLRTVAKYCDQCTCLCVSVCPTGYLQNPTRDLYQIFVHVAYGCGSVLLLHADNRPHHLSRGRGFLPHWQCTITRSLQKRSFDRQ